MILYLLLGYALSAALAAAKWWIDRRPQPKPPIDFRIISPRKTMNIGQPANIAVVGVDEDGNDAKFPPGTVATFAPIDASIATVTAGDDGLSEKLIGLQIGTITTDVTMTLKDKTITHPASVPYVPKEPVDFRIVVTPAL